MSDMENQRSIEDEFENWNQDFITDDGWTFRFNRDGLLHLEAIPPEEDKRQLPDTLFKIMPLNKRSVENFLSTQLYAAHPLNMNDAAEPLSERYNPPKSVAEVERLMNAVGIEVEEQIDGSQACRLMTLSFADTFGSLCFVEHVDSFTDKDEAEEPDESLLLMWAHYADKNSGFAVEYDYTKFNEDVIGPFQVRYTKLQPMELEYDKLFAQELSRSLTKSKAWSYENERRMFFVAPPYKWFSHDAALKRNKSNEVSRLMKYPIDAVKSVTFGFRFTDDLHRVPEELKDVDDLPAISEEKRKLIDYIVDNDIKVYQIALHKNGFCPIRKPLRLSKETTERGNTHYHLYAGDDAHD